MAHPQPATVIGGPVSPYVRKVLAVCEMKAIPYRLDPIVPFFGSDGFTKLSPLRRVPVFIDDEVSLCDSTVICEYLEDRYPEGIAPREGFLFGDISIADISVALFAANLRWARVEPDGGRWPKAAAWVNRVTATPALAKVTRYGDALMRSPPDQHRQVLSDLGVQVTDTTLASNRAQRGPMTPFDV